MTKLFHDATGSQLGPAEAIEVVADVLSTKSRLLARTSAVAKVLSHHHFIILVVMRSKELKTSRFVLIADSLHDSLSLIPAMMRSKELKTSRSILMLILSHLRDRHTQLFVLCGVFRLRFWTWFSESQ